MGVGHHQAHTSEAALFEATEELPPEGLAFAVADLQPQQLPSPIGVDAMATTTAREQTCSVLPSRPWRYVASR
jgi:hypothetical protein